MQPEIKEKLEVYHSLLQKWQKALNLVSPSTLKDARARHFEDSLQLVSLIKKNTKSLADLGTGAGFPGLVLAMACPELEVHLIESDERKCTFLRTVSRETNTPVVIHNKRIDDVDISVDIITARALASLSNLCSLTEPFFRRQELCVAYFMKGKSADQEIVEAQTAWSFKCIKHPSLTDKQALILELSKLEPALCE